MSSPKDTVVVPTHSVTITLTTGELVQVSTMQLTAQHIINDILSSRRVVLPEDADVAVAIAGLSRRRRRSRAQWLKKGASLTLSIEAAEVSNILGESLIDSKMMRFLTSLGITEMSTDIKALA